MNPQDFVSPAAGQAIRSPKGYWAFIPASLPPALNWTAGLVSLAGEAERALAELSTVGKSFPAPHVLTSSFIRQEAVMSSRIEGTQATLEEIYQYEAGVPATQPKSDAREVHNYVSALDH